MKGTKMKKTDRIKEEAEWKIHHFTADYFPGELHPTEAGSLSVFANFTISRTIVETNGDQRHEVYEFKDLSTYIPIAGAKIEDKSSVTIFPKVGLWVRVYSQGSSWHRRSVAHLIKKTKQYTEGSTTYAFAWCGYNFPIINIYRNGPMPNGNVKVIEDETLDKENSYVHRCTNCVSKMPSE